MLGSGGQVAAKLDLVRSTKKLKSEFAVFHMDIKRWRRFKSRHKLDWQKVRFDKAGQSAVPQERGIYVFSVELEPSKLPIHGYMMYVGITGHDAVDANLRKRVGQYLGYQRRDSGRRPRMRYMLRNWRSDLFFNFAPLPNLNIDLEKMEQAFISAVIPPVNRTDFDADLAGPVIAAF